MADTTFVSFIYHYSLGFASCFAVLAVFGKYQQRREATKVKHAVTDAPPSTALTDPQTCKHDLKIIAAQPARHTVEVVSPVMTIALYKCTRCPIHQTGTYLGDWTIDQLLQSEPLPFTEVAQLKRMFEGRP